MGNAAALATLRNSQRAVIFLIFIPAVVVTVNTFLRFFKGKIDNSDGSKYE